MYPITQKVAAQRGVYFHWSPATFDETLLFKTSVHQLFESVWVGILLRLQQAHSIALHSLRVGQSARGPKRAGRSKSVGILQCFSITRRLIKNDRHFNFERAHLEVPALASLPRASWDAATPRRGCGPRLPRCVYPCVENFDGRVRMSKPEP